MGDKDPLIKVVNLKKWFPVRKGIKFLGKREYVKAVDGVTFHINEGEVFGLAGESGCGKTTTGRTVLRLVEPTAGEVFFDGQNIFKIEEEELRKLRKKMQIIFQDPYESLSPRMTIFDIISEPIRVHKLVQSYEEQVELVSKTLERVELVPPEEFLHRYPHELSGGQRQRAAIARALVLNPKFIVADEPVSMLDVSIRAGILKLMLGLRDEMGLSYLFITHDLATTRHVCDRLAIMYLGKIVEMGDVEDLVREPIHPYTEALLAAVPVPDPTAERIKVIISGEVPSSINPPPGCRFHPRCPYAKEICRKKEPGLVNVEVGRQVACHLRI